MVKRVYKKKEEKTKQCDPVQVASSARDVCLGEGKKKIQAEGATEHILSEQRRFSRAEQERCQICNSNWWRNQRRQLGGGGVERMGWEACQRADGISGRVHLSTLCCSENTGLQSVSPTTRGPAVASSVWTCRRSHDSELNKQEKDKEGV